MKTSIGAEFFGLANGLLPIFVQFLPGSMYRRRCKNTRYVRR